MLSDDVTLNPVHPGEVLLEEFMQPLGLSANGLAKSLGVPTNRITAIVNGTRGVTADTAIRLGLAFETTPEFWINLQSRYDLDVARESGCPDVSTLMPRAAG